MTVPVGLTVTNSGGRGGGGGDELNPANLIGLGGSDFAKGVLGGPLSFLAGFAGGGESPGSTSAFTISTSLDVGTHAAAGVTADPFITVYPQITPLLTLPATSTWTIPVKELAEGVASAFDKVDPISYAVDGSITAFVAIGCGAFNN